MVTETDQLAAALDAAAIRWPECASERADLLRQIISLGVEKLEGEERQARKLKALAELEGQWDKVWPENWREDQLAGWPE